MIRRCLILAVSILFNSHYTLAFKSLLIAQTKGIVVRQSSVSERARLNSVRSSNDHEDIFSAVRRKEYELQKVKQQHQRTSDPVQMAMGYAEQSIPKLRVAKALRRVYDDEENPANAASRNATWIIHCRH
jgi:hypothetical protein